MVNKYFTPLPNHCSLKNIVIHKKGMEATIAFLNHVEARSLQIHAYMFILPVWVMMTNLSVKTEVIRQSGNKDFIWRRKLNHVTLIYSGPI